VPEALEVSGRVLERLPGALYRVALSGGSPAEVSAHVGGEAPLLRLRPGDEVVLALHPFDAGRGRILRKAGPGERWR
jgi:translation initiation factor IF-1